MERADLYIVEAVSRALQAAAKEGTIGPSSRLYDAAEALNIMIAGASGSAPGAPLDTKGLKALVRSITRDLVGRVMKNPISGQEPTVQMPSLREIAASTEFAEEAFPPDDEDEDL
jgi:hypothetical protein